MPLVITGSPKGTARRIRQVGDRANDLSPLWPKIGKFLRSEVNKQFRTQGAHFGTPWKPLKPATMKYKIAHHYSRKILIQRGILKDSFTNIYGWGHIEEYGPHQMTFGSNLIEAVWHTKGTRRNGKRVNPSRKMLITTRDLRREVKVRVAAYVTGKSQKSLRDVM